MPSVKDLTAIIVTYNSQDIIKRTIANFDDCPEISIIIVDNASKDNTIQEVESLNQKNIKIIKIDKNSGFARANNRGLEAVETKYALIINPDCEIERDSIEKVLSKIDNHDELAILSTELYASETIKDKIASVKKPLQKILDDDIYDVKFISGCCMFLDMKKMQKIGFFDEGFFLYCEDNELCKRILNKKYKLGIVKGSKAIHRGGKSSSEPNEKTRYGILWHRFGWSKCYYTQKVHNKLVAKLKAVRDIIKCLFKILSAKIKGKQPDIVYRAKLSGCFSYLISKKAFDRDGNPNGF